MMNTRFNFICGAHVTTRPTLGLPGRISALFFELHCFTAWVYRQKFRQNVCLYGEKIIFLSGISIL